MCASPPLLSLICATTFACASLTASCRSQARRCCLSLLMCAGTSCALWPWEAGARVCSARPPVVARATSSASLPPRGGVAAVCRRLSRRRQRGA
eukprot:8140832-Pyramimonas_sp.AAC.1